MKTKTKIIILIMLISILTIDFYSEKATEKEEIESNITEKETEIVKGRFEIVETFTLFDNSYSKGQIWKDRKTGKCFLYFWGSAGYGGPALTNIECEQSKRNN